MAESIDLSDTVRARVDQLNADDFKVFPNRAMLARIVSVTKTGTGEQPVSIRLSAWDKPWKPCLTMRRVMIELWGTNGADYVGKAIRLVRDPKVSFGDQREIGGIRISHMSDVPRDVNMCMVTTTRGKRAPYRVDMLTPAMMSALNIAPDPLLPLRAACNAALRRGWTKPQVLAVLGCDEAKQTPEEKRPAMIEALNGDPPSSEREPGSDG